MKLLNLKKNTKYLLACSFGPDSTALFHLLIKNNIDFDVAYVNYNLPYTGQIEKEKLIELCKKYNKKLFIKDVFYEKGNEESWAREVRYDFFASLTKENKYEAVLVAHNKDDLVETYFLQLKRSGYYSYYGLKEIQCLKETKIIRPLLKIRKKKLETYLKKNKLDYYIDSSNLVPMFQRNEIRINKVSKMSDFKINQIYIKIKLLNEHLARERNKYLALITDKKIYLEKIKNLNISQFIKLFYVYLSLFPFIKKFSEKEIIDLYLKIKSTNNMKAELINEYYLFLEYGYIKIDKIYNSNYSYILNKDGNNIFKFCQSSIFNEIFDKFDKILIQPVKKDDTYLYKDKLKKVSRHFIDMKLPTSYRKIWPGVYDLDGNLLYLPRYKENFKEDEAAFLKFKLDDLLH